MKLGELIFECIDQAQADGHPVLVLHEAPFFHGLAIHLGIGAGVKSPVPVWAEDQMRAHWRDRLAELREQAEA